jgi:aryl-alcohol dehydrogenase-like predicted oxidoreductase
LTVAQDILPYCQANGIGTLIRGPIARGVLAGKFTPETTFDDSVPVGWNTWAGRERFLRELATVN